MKPKAIRALQNLSAGNAALFHKLRVLANSIHGDSELGRSLLQALDRDGAQTVPQLAKARGVSRQHVQTAINALIANGAVERSTNPAHKRSVLMQLTASGKKLVGSLRQKEAEVLAELDLGVSSKELAGVAESLERIVDRLERAKS